jgi:uncharacterized Tic20 family protein
MDKFITILSLLLNCVLLYFGPTFIFNPKKVSNYYRSKSKLNKKSLSYSIMMLNTSLTHIRIVGVGMIIISVGGTIVFIANMLKHGW